MKKIGEINESVNRIHVASVGILMTSLAGVILFYCCPIESILNDVQRHPVELVSLIPSILLMLLIHELIHVLFFYIFNKQAKIRVRFEHGALFMHQVNEDVFYSKSEMFVILLSPFFLLSMLFYILMIGHHAEFTFSANLLINTMGSSIDGYVSWRLLQYPSHVRINFCKESVHMNIYAQR